MNATQVLRRGIIALVVSLTAASWCRAQSDDYPNTCGTGTRVQPDGTPIDGIIDPYDDQDWFVFRAQQSHAYRVTILDFSQGFYGGPLSIYDQDCSARLLLVDSLSFSTGVMRADRDGDLNVGFNSEFYQVGTYSFSITDMGAVTDDHGNQPGEATPITPDGSVINAQLNYSGDVDYFRANLEGGVMYSLDLSSHIVGGEVDATMIKASDQSNVTWLHNSGPYDGVPITYSSRLILVPPDAGGEYDVRVEVVYPDGFPDVGEYAFRVRTIGPIPPDDFGDTCEAAHLLTASTAWTSGTLTSATDQDDFAIHVPAGNLFSIEVHTAIFDREVRYVVLAGDCETPLSEVQYSSYGDPVQILSGVDTPCFLQVDQGNAYAIKNYEVRVVDLGPVVDDYGNGRDSATVITPDGSAVIGRIDYVVDVDFFRIDLMPGVTYQIEIQSDTTCRAVDAVLYRGDNDRSVAGITNQPHGVGCGSGYEDPWLWYTVPHSDSVQYFIAVSNGGHPVDSVHGYSLRVRSLGELTQDEHADTCQNATVLQVGAAPVFGALQSASDHDRFSFDAVQGRLYVVTLNTWDGGGGNNAPATIFAPGCVRQIGIDNQVFLVREADAGLCSIDVTYGRVTDPFAYEIQVEDLGPATDDHGNLPSTATPISTGGTLLAGVINYQHDIDMFTFSTLPRTSYELQVTALNCQHLWVVIRFGDYEMGYLDLFNNRDCDQPTTASTTVFVPQNTMREAIISVRDFFGEGVGIEYSVRVRQTSCPADIDGNGVLDATDFFGFLTAFLTLDPSADIDGYDGVNSQDFFQYVTAYLTGCP